MTIPEGPDSTGLGPRPRRVRRRRNRAATAMTYTVLVVVASIDIAEGPALLGWFLTAVFFALLAWDLGAPLLRGRERGTQGEYRRESGRENGRETEPGR